MAKVLNEYLKNAFQIDATGNYSVTGTEWKTTVPTGKTWRVKKLVVSYTDTTGFSTSSYGNGITLSNGVDIYTTFPSGATDTGLVPFPIVNNSMWGNLGTYQYTTMVEDQIVAELTFDNLIVDEGGSIAIYLNDDFTGLTTHRFLVHYEEVF